jgi:hypothetical protein
LESVDDRGDPIRVVRGTADPERDSEEWFADNDRGARGGNRFMKFGAGAVKQLGRHVKCCRISGLVGEAADVRRLEHRNGDDGRSVVLVSCHQ